MLSGSGSGLKKFMDPDPVCPERLDPDTDQVCPERLDPDPVNIKPDLQPCVWPLYKLPFLSLIHWKTDWLSQSLKLLSDMLSYIYLGPHEEVNWRLNILLIETVL